MKFSEESCVCNDCHKERLCKECNKRCIAMFVKKKEQGAVFAHRKDRVCACDGKERQWKQAVAKGVGEGKRQILL